LPDPRDPTPVRAVKRGGKWFVVDSSGKKLPDTGPMESAEAVRVAGEVNSSWKRARRERKGKVEEAAAWNPLLHPRTAKGRRGGGMFRAAGMLGRRTPPAGREGLEGPFRYRSGWEGYYDPGEGRYLGTDDVYMPRDFDPETATTPEPRPPRPGTVSGRPWTGRYPNVTPDEADRILRPIGQQLERNQMYLPERARIGYAPRAGAKRKRKG
jgi:hypothetical protein